MIQFQQPRLTKAHSGHAVIELTERGTWEEFPEFAKRFTKQIEGKKIDQVDGPDVRFWDIELKGEKMNLGYEDFPNGISLMSYTDKGDLILNDLFGQLVEQSDERNGV